MQVLFYVSVFVFLIASAWTYTIPEPTVQIIKPKGFRISIPNEDGITEVLFNVKLDQRISIYQPGDFAANIKEPTNDRWAFDSINGNVTPGSNIYYWIHVQFGKLGKHFRDAGAAVVSAYVFELSSLVGNDCPVVDQPKCELSTTTVLGKSVCKGQLIFEDDFGSLDSTKWQREVRIPVTDDGQFVSFQSRNDVSYVSDDVLHVMPRLLANIPAYGDSGIRAGVLDLGDECTAVADRLQECKRKAQYFQILPPIISARIRTKNSFVFRYGVVEIKAKLPKGDWLFPLIMLEPLESFFDAEGHSVGQIRVAFNRGNEILVDQSSRDISNKFLSGGAAIVSGEKLGGRAVGFDLSEDFHTYILRWTEDRMTFEMDGKTYATRQTGPMLAPFEREFFLTLGVSAGGHAEFPDESRNGPAGIPKPWKNGDPKAELNFWKDRSNWHKTWHGVSHGLHVDYVRVFAL